MYAVYEGHQELAVALHAQRVSTDLVCNDGDTPMLLAAQRGHLRTMMWLRETGIGSIDDRDVDGSTAMRLACLCGSLEAVQWLDQEGADLTSPDSFGTTPLMAACTSGSVSLVEWFLEEKGAVVTGLHGEGENVPQTTLIHLAARSGGEAMVEWLLSHGGSTSERDSNGRTPLLFCAEEGNYEGAVCLLSHGADPRAVADDETTTLMLAAGAGKISILRHMQKFCLRPLRSEPLVAARNASGFSVLSCAALGGNRECVEWCLEEAGCSLHVRDNNNHTALSLAALSSFSCTEYILDYIEREYGVGCINLAFGGFIAIVHAAARRQLRVVQLLSTYLGCDAVPTTPRTEATDWALRVVGYNPLQAACAAQLESRIRSLLHQGWNPWYERQDLPVAATAAGPVSLVHHTPCSPRPSVLLLPVPVRQVQD